MRISYFTETYPPELNGVAFTVARTIRHLRERGHTVDLIRPRQRHEAGEVGDSSQWLTSGWPIPMYRELRFGYAGAAAVKRRLQQSQPDLVHLATPGPLAWNALRAAQSLGIPTTSDFRTNFHQYSSYYHLGVFESLVLEWLRRFHNKTDLTFVPTSALRGELEGEGFRHLAVVGRGVDTRRFNPEFRSAELRREWGVADDTPVLLSVGRVAAEKNILLTMQAFEAARRRRPDTRLVVVGDGPLRQRLEAKHLEVRFMGAQKGERLAACYASADVFVFPSLSETFGNVTLEALASGLPVVAYQVAAAAEHVAHRITGLVVPPGDERAFKAAVSSLVTRPQRRASMSLHAAEAAQKIRWEDVLARFESHLQSTIDTHEAPSATPAVVA